MFKQNATFEWNEVHQQTFLKVKALLMEAPILRAFCPGRDTITVSDGSKEGGGAVLMQRESVNDSYYVVAYWSKRYSTKESRRSTTDLELRALLGCIEAWKHWLKGHKFTALTDHQALTYLYTKDQSQRSTFEEKAIVKLAEYQLMDIQYIPGKHNVVADYLSRSTNQYQNQIFAGMQPSPPIGGNLHVRAGRIQLSSQDILTQYIIPLFDLR